MRKLRLAFGLGAAVALCFCAAVVVSCTDPKEDENLRWSIKIEAPINYDTLFECMADLIGQEANDQIDSIKQLQLDICGWAGGDPARRQEYESLFESLDSIPVKICIVKKDAGLDTVPQAIDTLLKYINEVRDGCELTLPPWMCEGIIRTAITDTLQKSGLPANDNIVDMVINGDSPDAIVDEMARIIVAEELEKQDLPAGHDKYPDIDIVDMIVVLDEKDCEEIVTENGEVIIKVDSLAGKEITDAVVRVYATRELENNPDLPTDMDTVLVEMFFVERQDFCDTADFKPIGRLLGGEDISFDLGMVSVKLEDLDSVRTKLDPHVGYNIRLKADVPFDIKVYALAVSKDREEWLNSLDTAEFLDTVKLLPSILAARDQVSMLVTGSDPANYTSGVHVRGGELEVTVPPQNHVSNALDRIIFAPVPDGSEGGIVLRLIATPYEVDDVPLQQVLEFLDSEEMIRLEMHLKLQINLSASMDTIVDWE